MIESHLFIGPPKHKKTKTIGPSLFIIQIYKEYPSICQYKHLAAAVGLTDRYLRPIPCQHAVNQGAPKY